MSTKQEEDLMFDPSAAPPALSHMIACFLRITLPSIFTNLFGFLTVVTNSVFAGRMNDPVKLAVVGLTNVCCNLMVLSFLIGLNSAQETLTSQAYGAKNPRLCGTYLI